MKVKTYYTKLSWLAAVKEAKIKGHKFLGLTWDAACFDDLVIIRRYDV